ncbi:MAG: hypothetical protein ACI8Q1_001929 [Parvicella sp.]|jgi:hypothetical protein
MKKLILISLGLFAGMLFPMAQITTTGVYTYEDTVKYVDAKTSGYLGIPLGIDPLNGATDDGYVQYAQRFEAPDTVTINGGCFYAVMDFDPTDTLYLMLYDTLSSGAPGAVIDSVELMALTLGSGYSGAMNNSTIELCGDFATPIKRKGSYFMGMQHQDNTDMYVARNTDGDGAAEQLNWMYYKWLSDPQYDGWYQTFSFGTGWNFDFVVRPLVVYDAEMTVTMDTAFCLGGTLVTTTTFEMNDDLLSNKFYNPNYATYTGYTYADSINFDNGAGLTNDTSFAYVSGGVYNVMSTIYPDVAGWTLTAVQSTVSDMVTVTDPAVDLGIDLSGCTTDSVVLDAGAGFDTYLWSDATTEDALTVQLSGLANGANDYFVDVSINGCTATDSIVITVGDPAINLGNDTTICLNQSIDLDAGAFDSYDWSTGQTTQNVTVGPSTMAGDVIITVDVADGSCSGSDTIVITIDDCLSIYDLESALNIFPNPVQNELNIVVEGMDFATWTSCVMDASGKIVIQATVFDSYHKIDVSNLESGIYFVTVGSNNTTVVKQISIIK